MWKELKEPEGVLLVRAMLSAAVSLGTRLGCYKVTAMRPALASELKGKEMKGRPEGSTDQACAHPCAHTHAHAHGQGVSTARVGNEFPGNEPSVLSKELLATLFDEVGLQHDASNNFLIHDF